MERSEFLNRVYVICFRLSLVVIVMETTIHPGPLCTTYVYFLLLEHQKNFSQASGKDAAKMVAK